MLLAANNQTRLPHFSVPGWQKVKSFSLCLNGTFQDPNVNIANASYADTISVVNCQQVSRGR
jgi:hypothetical protein